MAEEDTILLEGGVVKIQANYLNFYFHIINNEQITLSTDITDHIVEDHTIIQDHITIKPRVFTMRGFISEKVYEMPNKSEYNQWIENISNKLTPLKVLAPTVNSYFQSAINLYEAIENKIEQIADWAKTVNKTWFKSIFKKNNSGIYGRWSKDFLQGNILHDLDLLRIYRVPVDIYTGWGVNYLQEDGCYFYITDVSVVQGDTYQQSDLSVTVKELRFATTKTRALTQEELNRFQIMSQESTNTITGSETIDPFASKMYKASGRT